MKTILLVDDEAQLRILTAGFFERRNYKVLQADGGNNGIELLKSNEVDVIISDVRMPRGDGITLLKQLRDGGKKIPPVILISGNSEFTENDAQEAGASALLQKPFDFKKLLATVSTLVPTG